MSIYHVKTYDYQTHKLKKYTLRMSNFLINSLKILFELSKIQIFFQN